MTQLQFLPGDLAQIESEDEKQRRRQEQAQRLMQAGFNPVANANPILAILGSVMSTIRGNAEFKDAEGKLSENLKKRFEFENQSAQQAAAAKRAEREENQAFELRKLEEGAAATARHRAPDKASFEERLFEQLPPNLRSQAALGKFGLGPKAGPGPSESDRKIAQLRQLGASDDQIRSMLLGNAGGGNAPSGYRATATGALEPIPGGPADKPKEADTKVAAAQQAREILAKMQQRLDKGETWTGPVDQFIPGQGQQQFESDIAQLVNPFQTLTRIPGQGAQSDKELATLMASFPALGKREGVNAESIKTLTAYLDKLQSGQAPQGVPQMQQAAPQGVPAIGSVVTGPDGRQYRATGDPRDPDMVPL